MTVRTDASRRITPAHHRKYVVDDAAALADAGYTPASDAYMLAVDAAHAIHHEKHHANVCSQSIIARERHAHVPAGRADDRKTHAPEQLSDVLPRKRKARRPRSRRRQAAIARFCSAEALIVAMSRD